MAPKKKLPKTVSYELIEQKDQPEMFLLLKSLIEDVHDHLTNARVALAWHKGLKPDLDGKVVIGKAKKASDLDRELAPYDFVLVLNRKFWLHETTSEQQRRALMDHELSHCEVEFDGDDEPKVDAKGRTCYRIRKHDIEEFVAVVERNGIWKKDLEVFAKTLRGKQPQAELFDFAAHARAEADETAPKAAK